MKKVLSILVTVLFIAVGCKKEVKKEQAAFNISGMTCAIGCAKKIASDLSKKEGVITADVNFEEKLATVEYDANKTSKEDLMTFVNGIADGKTYKACNVGDKACCDSKKKACDSTKKEGDSLKKCDSTKKACDSVKKCDKKEVSACSEECKKACAKGDAKCTENCDKECQEKCKKVEVKKAA